MSSSLLIISNKIVLVILVSKSTKIGCFHYYAIYLVPSQLGSDCVDLLVISYQLLLYLSIHHIPLYQIFCNKCALPALSRISKIVFNRLSFCPDYKNVKTFRRNHISSKVTNVQSLKFALNCITEKMRLTPFPRTNFKNLFLFNLVFSPNNKYDIF